MKARSRAASSSTSRSSTSTPRRISTVEAAGAWVDAVGIGALLPGAELVLPSLWEAVAGTREVEWGVRRADGKLEFTPEMARCWAWKDELPARRLAVVGKHFGRWAAIAAPRLVPALYSLTGRAGRPEDFRTVELAPLQRDVAEAVLEAGPSTPAELRALVGAEKKHVDAAVVALQRAFVLTNAHLVRQKAGWGAIAVELVARHRPPGALPAADEAERTLARCVLASSGEVSAADLGGALGWRVKRSRAVLDELAGRGEARARLDNDVTLYSLSDS
jgi:hypothetical protein